MSAGISGEKRPLWADFSFLKNVSGPTIASLSSRDGVAQPHLKKILFVCQTRENEIVAFRWAAADGDVTILIHV